MAITGGVVEAFKRGPVSYTTGAAVTAGKLVELSGNRTVQHAGATSVKVVGVALQTSDASGDVISVDPGGIYYLVASGTITAGDQLITDTAGRVKTLAAAGGATAADINNARAIVAIALEGAVDAATCRCMLRIGR